MKYAIYIHSEEGIDGYGVIVPDLIGCVSHGDTVDDAFRLGCEAVQFHVDEMLADNDPLPRPRSVEQILAEDDLADYENESGYWAFVEVKAPEEVAA